MRGDGSTLRRGTFVFVTTLGVCLVGCARDGGDEPPARARTADRSATTTKDAGSASTDQDVDSTEARNLIDEWLSAQNTGDFASYEGLYARNFEGIKRAGARVWRFDRSRWMADRKRIFAKPITVSARDVAIRVASSSAMVELIQSFRAGTFQDEGPKQLLLVRTDMGYRIAREEMLRSVERGSSAAPPGFVVMAVGEKSYVVLSAEADPAWGRGPLRGPYDQDHLLALQDAAPPDGTRWMWREFKVFGADGRAFDAKVVALALLAGGTPYSGERDRWNGNDPTMEQGRGRIWSQSERAQAVFNMAAPYLVGELAASGDCRPLVAVDPGAATVVFPAVIDTSATEAALAAFRAQPEYETIQRDFVGNHGGKRPWATKPTTTVYEGAGRRFVLVTASEGAGCGGFWGRLAVLFEDRNGTLRPQTTPDDYFRLDLLIDVDGDGRLEMIGALEDWRMVRGLFAGKPLTPVTAASFPFQDCGC